MSKTYIILSTYVDDLIKDMQPDINFFLFRSLTDLSDYISRQPIRADNLYITTDMLKPATSQSLSFLSDLLKNPFLLTDNVLLITERGSQETTALNYFINELKLNNWKIVNGSLNREYITNYICGTLAQEDLQPERRAVYRQKKSEYIRNQMQNKQSFEEHYETEEELLEDVEQEENTDSVIIEAPLESKLIEIAGIESRERTIFAFLVAQYLAFNGKTVIIEKDFEYLTLTDITKKSNANFLFIEIRELYADTERVLDKIKKTETTLIIIGSTSKLKYSYSYICNILYNNLSDFVNYFVIENNFSELAPTTKYTTIIPSDTVSILKTIEEIPDNYLFNSKFVAVNTSMINELYVSDSRALSTVVSDLLGMEYKEIPILNIRSLALGGDAYDLRMLLFS